PTKIQGARRLLVEAGLKEESLKQFPPLQTILLNEKLAFETRRDELLTIVSTPWSDLATAVVKEKGIVNPLFIDLLPRVLEARCRQVRLEQRIAILRHVEAIRLFASEHGGKLPAALAKVRVRLPYDPATGKPFEYEVKDGVAHLSAGAVKDQKVQYEITIN
ncbi:MAG TPA: hypothetical protein VLM40_12920, partial [Gemmata sp.]|nr:hypothetical protein [Gemmata sp.]